MSLPLQHVCSGYNQIFKSGVVVPPSHKQIQLFMAKATNNSGSTADLGIVRRLADDAISYIVKSKVVAAITDITASLQAGSTTNIIGTTNNDGFYVASVKKFGLVGFTVSQAETGSPVYTYKYWNGTSFSTLTTIAVPSAYSAADQVVIFMPPVDWVKGDNSEIGNLGMYTIKVIATTAPGTIVQATAVWCGQFLDYLKSVLTTGSLSLDIYENSPLIFDSGESLAFYFGAANAANSVRAIYCTQG